MPDYIGTLTFTIPSYVDTSGTTHSSTTVNQSYQNNLDYSSNISTLTGYTGLTYYAVGGSRIQEKLNYGTNGHIGSGIVSGSISDGRTYSGYSFTYNGATLQYVDYSDGYTMITGHTTGFTQETIFSNLLTRNEHFLGFVEEPRVYSDVFVERGKMGVMEKNLRLGEIDNTGELEIYGNKYFHVKNQ